jgi:hypothetical protein
VESIGIERSDASAGPAVAHAGKAHQRAVAQRHHRHAFGQRDPGCEEGIARLRKEAPVIGRELVEGDASGIDEPDARRRSGVH